MTIIEDRIAKLIFDSLTIDQLVRIRNIIIDKNFNEASLCFFEFCFHKRVGDLINMEKLWLQANIIIQHEE
jgi:hypothetical protein